MAPKKVKKTKKQLDEEKALAEEQKRVEEELERKRQEEEAERRRIEEEKRRIAEEKRRQEELVRLSEQSPLWASRESQMAERRQIAANSRKKLLDDKYLACDPLPDPNNEKDLTTFITLWKESVDSKVMEAAERSQTAEDVIRSINEILVEAMCQYDIQKINWCQGYIKELRDIMLEKYNCISANVLMYIDNYTKYTDEEKLAEKEKMGSNAKKDLTLKPDFNEKHSTQDILFAIWANVQAKNKMYTFIDFDRYKTQLPRSEASKNVIIRTVWTSFDYISGTENAKKFDHYVVGGVVNSGMYEYPQYFIRQNSRWVMRRIKSIEDTLIPIPYPVPSSNNQPDPIQVQYFLPNYVFTTESDKIKVCVWDSETSTWSSDYIDDLQYDKGKRILEFTTKKFGPIAYIQPKTIDYPYDSWYIRCIEREVALLTIKTKRIEVNIEIHPLFVKLVEMEQPELAHLVNKQLHPGILLQELSKCGIHMLPEDDDAGHGGIHLKDKQAEERAIVDIAQTLKVFAFQSLRWNQQATEENIICRVRENPDNFRKFHEDDESDWKSLCWWNNKVAFIKARNCDETFNPEIYDDQVTHSILSLAVEGVQSASAFEQCQLVYDIDFIDNVQRTLRLTRLLAFTVDAFDKRTLEEQQS